MSKRTGEYESYKIYYCPEFEEGDGAEGCEYDEEGCMNLLEAMYRRTAEDFREAYKKKMKLERLRKPLYEDEIRAAEHMMDNCTYLLGNWAEKIMRAVETEKENEGNIGNIERM